MSLGVKVAADTFVTMDSEKTVVNKTAVVTTTAEILLNRLRFK